MKNEKLIQQIIPYVIVTLLFVFMISGCASFQTTVQSEEIEQNSEFLIELSTYEDTELQLSPGDELEIRFFYTPELNIEQTIRPDGKIALQLIGEIMVQGMTPKQLQEELLRQYSKHLLQIDVTVIVKSLSSKVVYVGGQVVRPGPVPYTSQMTVLEALMLAGGIKIIEISDRHKYRKVKLIRRQEDKWIGVELDLDTILKGTQSQMYYLKPLDIVYIPETSR